MSNSSYDSFQVRHKDLTILHYPRLNFTVEKREWYRGRRSKGKKELGILTGSTISWLAPCPLGRLIDVFYQYLRGKKTENSSENIKHGAGWTKLTWTVDGKLNKNFQDLHVVTQREWRTSISARLHEISVNNYSLSLSVKQF